MCIQNESYKIHGYSIRNLNGKYKKLSHSSQQIFQLKPSLSLSLSSSLLLSSVTTTTDNSANINNYNITNAGVVLLAGGKGKRMQSAVPKQFINLLGRPVFLRSLDIFTSIDRTIISSIAIVLDESYREDYQHLLQEDSRITWADPGKERQDSVFNGIQAIPDSCNIVGKAYFSALGIIASDLHYHHRHHHRNDSLPSSSL